MPKNVQELEVEAKLKAQGTKVDGGGLFGGTLNQVMQRPEVRRRRRVYIFLSEFLSAAIDLARCLLVQS